MASGNWNNSANAGVFFRNWNNDRSNDNNNVGFRSADYDANCPDIAKANTGDIGMGVSCNLAKSACLDFLVPKGDVNHA